MGDPHRGSLVDIYGRLTVPCPTKGEGEVAAREGVPRVIVNPNTPPIPRPEWGWTVRESGRDRQTMCRHKEE